jgi:hypothetical protein
MKKRVAQKHGGGKSYEPLAFLDRMGLLDLKENKSLVNANKRKKISLLCLTFLMVLRLHFQICHHKGSSDRAWISGRSCLHVDCRSNGKWMSCLCCPLPRLKIPIPAFIFLPPPPPVVRAYVVSNSEPKFYYSHRTSANV